MANAKIRLYVDHPLGEGQSLPLDQKQAHYLFGVMRLAVGAELLVFNGHDGEFLASVAEAGKRRGVLSCLKQTKPLQMPPDLWLLFAPIRKERTNFIVEKATELGAAQILPVHTRFTNNERIRQDRLQAHAVEAAEQCGGTYVPAVGDLQKLESVLAEWQTDRQLMFCDESLVGARETLGNAKPGPWAILIGPVGGFSADERKKIRSMPSTTTVSLGPRILRADTAAVAALTLWQSALGDW